MTRSSCGGGVERLTASVTVVRTGDLVRKGLGIFWGSLEVFLVSGVLPATGVQMCMLLTAVPWLDAMWVPA